MRGIYVFHIWNHPAQEWRLFSCRANKQGGPYLNGIPYDVDGDWRGIDALQNAHRATFIGDDGSITVLKDIQGHRGCVLPALQLKVDTTPNKE